MDTNEDPGDTAKHHVDNAIAVAALVFVTTNALMYLGWTYIRLAAELFGVTSSWLGADMVAYTDAQNLVGHLIFYAAVLLSGSLVWFAWKRSIVLVYVLAADIVVSTADWIISTLDPRVPGGLTDTLSWIQVLVFAMIFGLVCLMWQRGQLR